MGLEKETAALEQAKAALRVLHWLGSVNSANAYLSGAASQCRNMEDVGAVTGSMNAVMNLSNVRAVLFHHMRKQADAHLLEAFTVLARYVKEASDRHAVDNLGKMLGDGDGDGDEEISDLRRARGPIVP